MLKTQVYGTVKDETKLSQNYCEAVLTHCSSAGTETERIGKSPELTKLKRMLSDSKFQRINLLSVKS